MSPMEAKNYEEQSVEHEGSKSPVKSYEWDEIEDIDVEDPLSYRTMKEAHRAHTILHWGWDDRALPGWHYEEIIAEHARVVKYLTEKGERHVMTGSLDTTLPDDLKEASIRPSRDLTYIRSLNDDYRERFEKVGIDTINKLAKADIDELSEKTDFDPNYLEYLQEQAENL
ncbi:MAG: hypothetical protein ABEJ65_04855 [bacterium]